MAGSPLSSSLRDADGQFAAVIATQIEVLVDVNERFAEPSAVSSPRAREKLEHAKALAAQLEIEVRCLQPHAAGPLCVAVAQTASVVVRFWVWDETRQFAVFCSPCVRAVVHGSSSRGRILSGVMESLPTGRSHSHLPSGPSRGAIADGIV